MAKTITDLRDSLFDTIEKVKSGKLDIETAKAVADLSSVIVASARVEADYIKATGCGRTSFLEDESHEEMPQLTTTETGYERRVGNTISHRMR